MARKREPKPDTAKIEPPVATSAAGPVTLVREFESDREYILYVTRQNFRFAHHNGSADEFAFDKMSAAVREAVPSLKWDKSYMRRFVVLEKGQNDYINPIHMTMEDVVKLLQVSIAMRDKVEPHVRRAMAIMREADTRWGLSDTTPSVTAPTQSGPR